MSYYAWPSFSPDWGAALEFLRLWWIILWTPVIFASVGLNASQGVRYIRRLREPRFVCAVARHVWHMESVAVPSGGNLAVFLKVVCLGCGERLDYTLRSQVDVSNPNRIEIRQSIEPTITRT